MTRTRLMTAALMMLALLQAPATGAATLPEYYPGTYDVIGRFNGVNQTEGYIVINDSALPISPQARVYTPSSKSETLRGLRPGMTVAVRREHRGVPVTEVWVMPDGYREE